MLTNDEVERFVREGVVRIPAAVDPKFCEEQVLRGFERLGVSEDDPSTWHTHRIHMPVTQGFALAEHAPLALEALEQLLGGAERIRSTPSFCDNFIMVFQGEDRPYHAPDEEEGGWHKDGDWFVHFLDSPEQAILGIVLWRDLISTQGGTCYATDSIAPVARKMMDHPEGMRPEDFDFAALRGECAEIHELTGKAGDFIWMHPFTLHTAATNTLARPRVLTNTVASLEEPMCFDRTDGIYSPVERAVLRALGVDRIAYRATGERGRLTPEREKEWERQRQAELQRRA
jgi:hypothetical protein